MDGALSETPAEAWARCRPYLQAAFDRFGGMCPDLTVDDLAGRVSGAQAQFWAAPNGAGVTEMQRSLHVIVAGGELDGLLPMLGDAERWAASQECDRVTLTGRKGWSRVLAPLGYRPLNLLVKDIG